jgi:hypothetical protein
MYKSEWSTTEFCTLQVFINLFFISVLLGRNADRYDIVRLQVEVTFEGFKRLNIQIVSSYVSYTADVF